MKYPLAIYRPVSYPKVAYFRRMLPSLLAKRVSHRKVSEIILSVVNTYIESSDCADYREMISELKRQIRLQTKGQASQHEVDSPLPTELDEEIQNEQLYVANTVLLKSVWKALAQKLHPDKGGDPELFAAAHAAYRGRKLRFLQELLMQFEQFDDLVWITQHGLQYLETEFGRLRVEEEQRRNSILYMVYYNHIVGNFVKAAQYANVYLAQNIEHLQNELAHILGVKINQPYQGAGNGY